MKKIAFILLFTFGITCLSQAQNFRSRQRSQEKLIKTAYKKGRVTELEYEKLMKEQYVIGETMDRFYADNYLSPAEKNKLHDKLERADKRLRRYKRNGEVY
jgi:hypothetical protein